jgi:hypothetical protein
MIDTDPVIVRVPYPATSSAMISPPAEVTPYAAAKLRHGLADGQLDEVFVSLPVLATKVRAAPASAAEGGATAVTMAANAACAATAANVLTLIVPSLAMIKDGRIGVFLCRPRGACGFPGQHVCCAIGALVVGAHPTPVR